MSVAVPSSLKITSNRSAAGKVISLAANAADSITSMAKQDEREGNKVEAVANPYREGYGGYGN